MAIISLNQTVCVLCGKVLKDSEQMFSFPAFVSNSKDQFYQFNDSAFHIACLHKHPLGNKAIDFGNQFIFKTRPENRVCSIGGNLIQKFDDYIFIDLLTSDEQEDLSRFNFTTLDKNNLKEWTDRSSFITIASNFIIEGKWGDLNSYKYLDNLIDKIKV